MKSIRAVTFIFKNVKNSPGFISSHKISNAIQYSSIPIVKPKQGKMTSWQIHSYGDLSELQYSPQIRIPLITHPNQVMVKVEATSVNPIDVAMVGGYGATALNLMRNLDNVEFPITLGRDFCGKIVSKGLGKSNDMPIGTTVWGVVPVHQQGCHAEYVVVDSSMISEKPNNIGIYEAASTLYTGLTAWSGLKYSGGLKLHHMTGIKALVLGASGGVGNAVTQILKAGGATVTVTCAKDAVPLVESFQPDKILEYTSSKFKEQLLDCGRFDIIVDCAGLGSDFAVKSDLKFKNYVTFTTPVLKNFDNQGIARGLFTTFTDLVCPNVTALKNGGMVTWAYFVPSSDGIKFIHDLVSSKKLIPNVEKVYKYNETPLAYKRVQDGHLRGKIVIDVGGSV